MKTKPRPRKKAAKRLRNSPTGTAADGIREGLADIAAGRVKYFSSAKELIEDLHRHARAARARSR